MSDFKSLNDKLPTITFPKSRLLRMVAGIVKHSYIEMTIEKMKPMTPTIAIIPMNLTPSRSYLIFIGFGNKIDRTIEPREVLNPVRTTIP